MKIPVIKKLCESYTLEQLEAAEAAIADGLTPEIEIDGEDEGEQLTHAYAAKTILEEVKAGKDLKLAMRDFTQRVRNSISS